MKFQQNLELVLQNIKMEIVNKPYAKAFEDFAKDKEEILCISADLDSSC